MLSQEICDRCRRRNDPCHDVVSPVKMVFESLKNEVWAGKVKIGWKAGVGCPFAPMLFHTDPPPEECPFIVEQTIHGGESADEEDL